MSVILLSGFVASGAGGKGVNNAGGVAAGDSAAAVQTPLKAAGMTSKSTSDGDNNSKLNGKE